MLAAIRGFFFERGYLEVETPHLVPAPIPEAHIRFIETAHGVLHPSPELYMKRLLAAGHPRIFQIAHCFRDRERGDRHLREFTLLEWYCAGTDYRGLMETCEVMIRTAARDLGSSSIRYQGREIDLEGPWDRITVAEAFDRHAPEPLERAMPAGRFEEDLVVHVEPRLGTPRPTFLHDYPASMASLARLKPDAPEVCERVELYLGGLEIANGFSELTDPEEQRQRFERDVEERKRLGRRTFSIPEAFLEALGRMPDAAGMALGIDRLAMILTDSARIDDVVAFTPEDG
ncbi:MAG: EF-P lysine aminoacylase GenX [Deltaproteobacteria bacterium]|nr:EF-P lysine aminoacylase GenX [Deltaproteobacteria bacterium]